MEKSNNLKKMSEREISNLLFVLNGTYTMTEAEKDDMRSELLRENYYLKDSYNISGVQQNL